MPRRSRGPYLKWNARREAWYIHINDGGSRSERSTGTADRASAEIALAEAIRERNRASGGPRDPGLFLVTDALADYAEERGPEVTSADRIAYAVEALTGFWEGNHIADVTKETCRAYVRHRQRADGTVRRELGVLRAAINYAHEMGRLTRPVPVHLPPKPEGKDRWLTRDEAARLLRAARRQKRARLHLPLFILLALYTGARKGALLELRWPQVDFERGRIDLNPPGRRRTKKGRPVIRMPRQLRGHLLRAARRGPEVRKLADLRGLQPGGSPASIGYVLHRRGERLGDIKKGFAEAARAAGLEDVTPHTLRHTAGTWMAQKGVPLWEIAGWLGHSHERTSELYAHHHPDHLSRALEALES